MPVDFALGRVFPNPMQGSMHVEYGLPAQSAVHLSILDLQGREVAVLADGVLSAGWHLAGWNGGAGRGRAPARAHLSRPHGRGGGPRPGGRVPPRGGPHPRAGRGGPPAVLPPPPPPSPLS